MGGIGIVGLGMLVAAASCVTPDLQACGPELVCDVDSACVERAVGFVCVPQAQVTACAGHVDRERCSTDQIAAGRCEGGACFASICGDGIVDRGPDGALDDPGEACDDGNTTDRDGCSADCTSDETCGNAVVDFSTGERCDDGGHVDHDGCSSACQVETPIWQRTGYGTPPMRSQHGVTYDAARGQVVMFGGVPTDGSALLGDTWLWDGTGWRMVSPPLTPRPRRRPGMAYDPRRQRVVMFGGLSADGDALTETWEWDGAQWHSITLDVSPTGRVDPGMTYDGVRRAIVMFGGQRAVGGLTAPAADFADTWTWDGERWTLVETEHRPTSASSVVENGRSAVAMAFDPHRNRVVLVGGHSRSVIGPFDETIVANDHVWELDGTDWHEIVPPQEGPIARAGAVLAYNPVTRRMMLAGGANGSNILDDIWEWDGETWTQSVANPAPSGRRYANAATDLARERVVLFGGETPTVLGEPALWELAGQTWTGIEPEFAIPLILNFSPRVTMDERRGVAVMVDAVGTTFERARDTWRRVGTLTGTNTVKVLAYDAVQGVVVASSLASTGSGPQLTALWDGTAWTEVTPATSPTRRVATMARDRTGHVIMFSGYNSNIPVPNDTWRWDGTTWVELHPAHSPPARGHAAFGYDPERQVTVLFGGDGHGDTWLWDGDDWTEVTPPVSPSPRAYSSMVWQPVRRRLALVGGYTQAPTNDVWEWTGTTWEQVQAVALPRARMEPGVVSTRSGDGFDMIYGATFTTSIGDVWTLRWQSERTSDTCDRPIESDGDGLVGCADLDCWYTCSPQCPPATSCPADAARCGDGTCEAIAESCAACPEDCGACAPACGDGVCDASEDCAGDCP